MSNSKGNERKLKQSGGAWVTTEQALGSTLAVEHQAEPDSHTAAFLPRGEPHLLVHTSPEL